MTLKTPNLILDTIIGGGISRTKQTLAATFGLTFLAGAYIALGGFFAIRCAAVLPLNVWGSMAKLIFAAVFPLGLLLVIVCGADLFTGNCMSLAAARYRKDISIVALCKSGIYSWVGNFIGALFVAYFMAYASGLIFEVMKVGGQSTMPWANSIVSITNGKCALSFGEAFWRAVGCNWLVCLAVYAAAAAEDISGKILALWFPTMAFVAMGMEHCIANMFFVPLGIFTGTDPRYTAMAGAIPLQASWGSFFINNLVPVTLGNIVGGAILVAGVYSVIYFKKVK